MSKSELLEFIHKKKIIKASEALDFLSDNKELSRMNERGEIYQLGGGLYSSLSIDPEVAALLAITKYYPNAVISRSSALRVHELGDEKIRKVHIDIPNNQSIRNELVETHRVAEKFITDVIQYEYFGYKLRVYSEVRSLYEALKEYGESHEYFKAIKRYVEKHKADNSLKARKLKKLDQLFNKNISGAIAQEVSDDFF
jgi:predicted transcriptional regulator of viral defense system